MKINIFSPKPGDDKEKQSCLSQEELSVLWESKLAMFSTFQEKLLQLEDSVKVLVEMQCMVGEETLQILQTISEQVKHQDAPKQTTAAISCTQSRPEEPSRSDAAKTLHKMPPAENNEYAMQASVDRKHFLSLHKYLAEQDISGEGMLHSEPKPMQFSYASGKIVSLEMKCDQANTALDTFATQVEASRRKDWEAGTEDNLQQQLIFLIQKNTKKYLGGLTQVVQKLSKEQLIERLQSMSVPLLKRQDGVYQGEALFYYVVQQWPNQGKKYLTFRFSSKTMPVGENIKCEISILALLGKTERMLKNFGVEEKGQ